MLEDFMGPPGMTWNQLGSRYLGTDEKVKRVFDILAPGGKERISEKRWPVYLKNDGDTPEPDDVWALSEQIVAELEKDFIVDWKEEEDGSPSEAAKRVAARSRKRAAKRSKR